MSKNKGIGKLTPSILISALPEIGKLNKYQIAKLAGLAPMNKDSEMFRGKRSIIGGRKIVCSAIYMGTLSSIRFSTTIKSFYLSLKENGKSSKLSITACMRKFLIIINAQTYRTFNGLITF